MHNSNRSKIITRCENRRMRRAIERPAYLRERKKVLAMQIAMAHPDEVVKLGQMMNPGRPDR